MTKNEFIVRQWALIETYKANCNVDELNEYVEHEYDALKEHFKDNSWMKSRFDVFLDYTTSLFKRLFGLILFLSGAALMCIPFFILLILFGLNKANVIMSSVMRIPMNMFFGDKMGDLTFELHKAIHKGLL